VGFRFNVKSVKTPEELPDAVWRGLKVAAPARRALVDAGILTIEDLRRADVDSLSSLHGMGPSAIRVLRQALDG